MKTDFKALLTGILLFVSAIIWDIKVCEWYSYSTRKIFLAARGLTTKQLIESNGQFLEDLAVTMGAIFFGFFPAVQISYRIPYFLISPRILIVLSANVSADPSLMRPYGFVSYLASWPLWLVFRWPLLAPFMVVLV